MKVHRRHQAEKPHVFATNKDASSNSKQKANRDIYHSTGIHRRDPKRRHETTKKIKSLVKRTNLISL